MRHASRVAVLGTDVADALFPHQDPIGRPITIDGRAYQVVGVFEKKGAFLRRQQRQPLVIPITTFDEQFPQIRNGGGDTLHIATVPRRPEDYDALIEQETAILRARREPAPEPAERLRDLHQRRAC